VERGWGEVMKVSCMLVKNTNMGKGISKHPMNAESLAGDSAKKRICRTQQPFETVIPVAQDNSELKNGVPD
jgi:hypothetical protein